MIQLEVLVEEPSAEAALAQILPRILHQRARFRIINFGSKYKLMKELGSRLAGYRRRIEAGENLKIVVLVDRDSDDCGKLKEKLEKSAINAGLSTRSKRDDSGRFLVLNRIVVEELESWFIGDIDALRAAFGKLPDISEKTGIFRNPDNVSGGTWEALHRYLKKHGVYRDHYPKIEAARRISRHMNMSRNRSASFKAFVSGINSIIS